MKRDWLADGRYRSMPLPWKPNAALKSIVRRDNGQSYNDYLKELAKAAGIENPTREQLARLDRKRKKKGSNQEWMSPSDPGRPNHQDERWTNASGPQG